MRLTSLTVLVLLCLGCGGERREQTAAQRSQRPGHEAQPPVPSGALEVAARDLLPASVTTSRATPSVSQCLGAFERPTRCAMIQARGGGGLEERKRSFLAAARTHGWRLIGIQTEPNGSGTLTFRRGRLQGRVLLARAAKVAIVFVTEPSATTAEEARFVASARAACKRFAAKVGRIPRLIPRKEGLRRVRGTWHELVEDVSRLTPPPALRERHRSFLLALRAFEHALLPFRGLRVAEAANRVEQSARAVGLQGCIPD